MSTQRLKRNIGYILGGVVAIFFFLAPLLQLIIMSLTTDQGFGFTNYAELLTKSRTLQAIGNTVLIAVCSTLIAVVLGSVMAFLVAYTDVFHKKWMEVLTMAPFVIPSYIITLSWSTLLSARGSINGFLDANFGFKVDIYSLGGIILVLGICNASVVYLNVLPFLRKIPRDLEWAARVCGRNLWETLRCIDLTQAAPAIASGGMLAFLAAIDNFAVPAFLGIPAGIPVLSTYIYENVIGFGPSAFRSAAALSVMLSAIALLGTALQGMLVRRSSGMESIREDYSVRVPLGRARPFVQWITLAFLSLVNVVPLITTITSSFFPVYGTKTLENFTLENYAFVFTNRGILQAFANSAMLAVITCMICIVVGTALAYSKVRRHSLPSHLVEQSASLTYAIPGIVLALAMIFHWTMVPGVYGTILILMIAYVTRYLVLQIKSSTNAMLALDISLEESAAVFGSSKVRMWFRVILPLTIRPILSGTFLIFMQSLTELTLSSMLAAAGTRTIGLSIFSLQQGGDYQRAAAVSAVVIAAVVLAYGLSALLPHLLHKKRMTPEAAADVKAVSAIQAA